MSLLKLDLPILCGLLIFICHLTVGNKYSKQSDTFSKEDNDLDFETLDKPFRMQKVNLLWMKAKKQLGGPKLADLYADLKIHDKHEARLKKMRAENSDKDGAMEAKVLTSYKLIIERFGLDDFVHSNEANLENEIPNEGDEKKSIQFEDPKLQSMWKRAEQAGFSQQDLDMLKEEFLHQQMKINEYEFIHRELDDFADPDDNTIDLEQKKLGLSPREAKERKVDKKRHKNEIKEGYLNLERISSTLSGTELTFKDARVHKLWALAKKTNWTEEELDGFKEELKHFEHRLNKQAYYKDQLEKSALKIGDLEDNSEYPENHKHLEEKSGLISQKVKKIHSDLKTRIDKALKHSEL